MLARPRDPGQSSPGPRGRALRRRLKQAAVVFVVLLAAAQFVRPSRVTPPTDPGRTIQAAEGAAPALVAVLDRACRDCHSNETAWPWYTRIAPVSWLMAYAVAEGRKAANFSEWAGYPPERQTKVLVESCQDVKAGKMPGAYTLLHPDMRLSPEDVETICEAAQKAEALRVNGR